MRIIDADVAVENIEEWLNSVGTALIGKGLSYTGELMGCIEDAPTVDAVAVVRCEKCLYWQSGENECEKWEYCTFHNIGIGPHSFCSYGERKEGADNG